MNHMAKITCHFVVAKMKENFMQTLSAIIQPLLIAKCNMLSPDHYY